MRVSLSEVVENASFFSFDRNIFLMKFPTGFTDRYLHGFARFPSDITALAIDLRCTLY